MVAENACHDNQVPVTNAYTGAGNQYQGYDIAHETFADAVGQRIAEIANPQPIHPIAHEARTPAQQLRGLDDPQEWWLGGRPNEALPAATGIPAGLLLRDDAFNNLVQGHTAGTQPGQREAMVIRDGCLFVGSAEGIVSKFQVDQTTTAPISGRQPLVRVAKSDRLGHEAFALAALDDSGSWSLVVGTRRHLYKLDPLTLAVQAGPVQLPWEVAQPHHMKVADVLLAHSGKEIVFAAHHGGLVFFGTNLAPIHEWPEPGIADFFVRDGVVTILSYRGMLANVTFSGSNHVATLQAASQSCPTFVPGEPPCQGGAHDLEPMLVNWSGAGGGANVAAISPWSGDVDGPAVRGHWASTLAAQPYLQNLADSAIDIATCLEGIPAGGDVLGDHALVLGDGSVLSLYNQYGQLLGRKVLTTTTQPGYYPFAAGAHTLAVGELVGTGTAGPYDQEIVVATPMGLMWLHVNDLLGPGSALPAPAPVAGVHQPGYWMEVARTGGLNTHVQPRTNQTLAAAWAIARRPVGGDSDLHVLDQRGAYWKVGPGGQVALWERELFVPGARGWGYVGAVSAGAGFSTPTNLAVTPLSSATVITTTPWCPIQTTDLVYENTPHYVPNNWSRRLLGKGVFEGFLVHSAGGHVMTTASGDREAWFWTHAPAWGNLVEGLRMNGTGAITGIWASTGRPQTVTGTFPNEIGDKGRYHALRSFFSDIPVMTQQAVHAVKLNPGQQSEHTAVVLGRPGGRVSVLLPGPMRVDDSPSPGGDHGLGPNPADESPDLGYGGSALAVRHVTAPAEELQIWIGTISHPSKRPAAYTNPSGSLADDEVATGAVHRLTWTPGSGFATAVQTVTFHPTTLNARGAYGVVGLLLADLFPGGNEELVVATLSGDLLILDSGSMTEIWRTHLPGAIGLYNSMLAEDLDGVPGKELYVAGSWGLWRFKLDPSP